MLTQINPRKILFFQLIILFLVAIPWGVVSGSLAMMSVLYGGCCWLLPSLIFIWIFFGRSVNSPKRIILRFYFGELLKFGLSVILLIVVFRYISVVVLPLITGYIVVVLAFFGWPIIAMIKR